MDALLDTSVLIDLWRKHPPALSWAEAQRELVVGIHILVAMELVEGVRNNQELAHLDRLLAGYEVEYLAPSDCAWASEQHRRLRLSHGVGLLDALIASSAVRLSVPLYTLNLKHFQPLPTTAGRKGDTPLLGRIKTPHPSGSGRSAPPPTPHPDRPAGR
jgi:predicted nucleic acid-binding protein